MKDSPSVPQGPDPLVVGQQQYKMNADLARLINQMGMKNVQTPWGNLGFTQGQNADGTPSDQWTADISLSPQQQKMLDYQNQMGIASNQAGVGLSQQMAKNFGQGFDPYQFRDFASLPTQGNFTQSVDPQAMVKNVDLGEMPWQAQAASPFGMTNKIDTSGVSPMGNPYGYANDATQAILSRVNPELTRQKSAMDTQLANQGIPMGSEAWGTAQTQFGQQANDAVQQAVLQGYGLGSQQFQNTLAANQQGFGQAAQQAGFGNQAQAQGFGQSMQNAQLANQVKQAAFGQNLAAAEFANRAQQQMFNQGLANANLSNEAQQKLFGEQMQSGAYSDAQRQQDIQNQLALYQLPMNQMAQLQGMGKVTAPNFPQFGTPQGYPTNLLGAYQNQYQGQLAGYNAEVGSQNSMNQGLMNAAALAAMFFMSDRRLKSNIKRVGTHRLGIGIYEYDIFGHRERGVMADEVEQVMPAAVADAFGYKMVNYGML